MQSVGTGAYGQHPDPVRAAEQRPGQQAGGHAVQPVAAAGLDRQAEPDGRSATPTVSGSWGAQISQQALIGLIVFLILVTVFLTIYFERWMALAALIALGNDLIVTAGVYSMVGFEVSPATVIGLLTILGFSLYDAVVVFDKVRENTRGLLGLTRRTFAEEANLALNQTLMRSINTSLIALLPVLGLLVVGVGVLGVGTLTDLALVQLVGMLIGAASSLLPGHAAVGGLQDAAGALPAAGQAGHGPPGDAGRPPGRGCRRGCRRGRRAVRGRRRAGRRTAQGAGLRGRVQRAGPQPQGAAPQPAARQGQAVGQAEALTRGRTTGTRASRDALGAGQGDPGLSRARGAVPRSRAGVRRPVGVPGAGRRPGRHARPGDGRAGRHRGPRVPARRRLGYAAGLGVVPVRKPGKTPLVAHRVDYQLEYGTARLELPAGLLVAGQRVTIVDDVLATGGTVRAAAELVERPARV